MNRTSKASASGNALRPTGPTVDNSPVGNSRASAPGSSSSPANHLRINIDRITLHGYAPADQGRFTRTLSRELTKLAHAHGDIDWNKAAPLRARICQLDAGELRAGASAEDAARHVAQNIFEKLTQHRTRNRGSDHV